MRLRLLLLSALLAACSTKPPAGDGSRALVGLDAAIHQEPQADGSSWLRIDARNHTGTLEPVARLTGVRLQLGGATEPQQLPFVAFSGDGDKLVAQCRSPANHAVEVTLALSADGVRLAVADHIGLPSEVRELSLVYQLLGEEPVGEAFAPQLAPLPNQVAGEASFHLPMAWLRAGHRALAIVVDTNELASQRLLPQALEVDPGQRRLLHGCIAQSPERQGMRTLYARAAEGPTLGGVTLAFAHLLRVNAIAEPDTSLAALVDGLWQSSVAPWLQSSGGDGARTWASAVEELRLQLEAQWVPYRSNGGEVGLWSNEHAAASAVLRISWDRDPARTACAMLQLATRTKDPALHLRAVQAIQFLLAAPRHGSLPPSRIAVDAAHARCDVGADDGTDGHAGWLHTLDASWHALWLWRARKLVPEQGPTIEAACGEIARFLIANQTENGAFPGFFDPNYEAPRRDLLFDQGGESAGPALFLAEYGAESGDAQAVAAAIHALRLLATLRSDADWSDSRLEALRVGLPATTPLLSPASAIGRTFGALAAAKLVELLPAGDAAAAEAKAMLSRLLRSMTFYQQCWQRPWEPADRLGAMRASNLDDRWNDPITSLAAEAFLAGYAQLGEVQWLQRGALALRAAVASGDASGLQAGVNASEMIGARWGQAVVDVASGTACGLDSLWCEKMRRDGNVISLQLATTAGIARARVTFCNLPPVTSTWILRCNNTEVAASREQLAAGLDLPVTELPAVHWRPPTEVQRGQPWQPWITTLGDWPGSAFAVLELDGGQGHRSVLLEPSGHRLQAPASLACPGERGDTFLARIAVHRDGVTATTPAVGWRRFRLSDFHCVDPGDDDEHDMLDAGDSRAARCSDGTEGCRVLPPKGQLVYEVPVEADATEVELSLDVIGAARIAAIIPPEQGNPATERVLFEDTAPVASRRQLSVPVRDRRLWSDQRQVGVDGRAGLRLRILALEGQLEVLRIGSRNSGAIAAAPEPERLHKSAPITPHIRVAVLPLRTDDLPPLVANSEQIGLAWFGGAEYAVTPEPASKPTTGSAATLLTALSGGATTLQGGVAAAQHLDSSQLTDDDLARVLAAAQQTAAGVPVDVIALVHGGDQQLPPTQPANGPPIIWLAERRRDGSFLAGGDALAAVLRARFPQQFTDLAAPSQGAFGELTFAGAGTGHRPGTLPGHLLEALGFVDRIEIDRARMQRVESVAVPVLHEDRAYLRLLPRLPGRGDLLLEDRRQTRLDARSVSSILAYWDLAPGVVEIATPREHATVELLRLQADDRQGPSPFVPGTASSLLSVGLDTDPGTATKALSLDANTSPSVATAQGESVWHMDLRGDDPRSRLTVTNRCQEVGHWEHALWRTGHGIQAEAGMPIDADLGASGAVLTTGLRAGEQLRLRPRLDGVIVGWQNLPPATELLRLFVAVVADGEGDVEIRLGADKIELVRMRIDRQHEGRAEIDVPAGARRLWIAGVAGAQPPATASLRQCTLVPRQPAIAVLTPTPDAAVVAPLADGVHHSRGFLLQADGHQSATLEVPVAVPAGRSCLRLLGGLPAAATGGGDLDVEFVRAATREQPGLRERITFAQSLRLQRTAGVDPPLCALLHLPEQEAGHIWFLHLTWRAPEGTCLELQTLELVRP